MRWSSLPSAAKAGIIAVIVGFLLRISTTTVSGGECSYFDLGALLGGLAGVGLGIAALVGARKSDVRGAAAVVGALVLVLSVVNVLRGIGVIGGPC